MVTKETKIPLATSPAVEHIQELDFARIIRSKSIPTTTVKNILEAYELNKALFNTNIHKFNIIICDSPEEWRVNSKYYYYPFGLSIDSKVKSYPQPPQQPQSALSSAA